MVARQRVEGEMSAAGPILRLDLGTGLGSLFLLAGVRNLQF